MRTSSSPRTGTASRAPTREIVQRVRTVYLGTSEFAATVRRRLAATSHRPALVVTPPDRPKGRGRRSASPPAAEEARELGIELLQVESVNEASALERIRGAAPEAAA